MEIISEIEKNWKLTFTENRTYSPLFYKFSFILYSISPKCYKFVRNVIPLPCKSQLLTRFKSDINQNLELFESIDGSTEILRKYEKIFGDDTIPCCLAIDATEIYNDSLDKKDGLLIYQIQRMKHLLNDFVVHFNLSEKINSSIKDELELLKEKIKNTKFECVHLASDGDPGSQIWHEHAFSQYEDLIKSKCNMHQILEHLQKLTFWPISDWFRLLKNARDKIFHSNVYLNDKTSFVDKKKISQNTKYKSTISDFGDLSKLKDSYSLDMFSLSTGLNCLLNEDFIESAYIIPFSLVTTALTSEKLPIGTRIQLISKSFEFFSDYFRDYPKINGSEFLKQKRKGNLINTTLFTISKIKRILKTLIGIAYALINFPDYLALDRIGSHPVECFFGSTRIMLNNDNRLSVFVQKFNKIQMQKRFFEELGFKHPVKRFNLSAGAHLINSKLGDYSVDLDQLQIYSIFKNTCENETSNDSYQKLTEEILFLFEYLTLNNDIPKFYLSLANSGCMIKTRLYEKKIIYIYLFK